MNKFKSVLTTLLATIFLSACGSGLVGDTPDAFFQVQDTPAGNVCVNDFYPNPATGEDKTALNHIWKYYKGDARDVRTTYSDQGLDSTCGSSRKPKADVVVSYDFYINTIVPATP